MIGASLIIAIIGQSLVLEGTCGMFGIKGKVFTDFI